MKSYFEKQTKELYDRAIKIIDITQMLKSNKKREKFHISTDEDFKKDFAEKFFKIIDKVNLSLMEDKENFYGYFLFQMGREIRFDITSATSINFKEAKYVMYFNPIIFLELNMEQMQSTIKHEILHVLSQHLIRLKINTALWH